MARLVTIHIDKLELDVVMGVFIHMATTCITMAPRQRPFGNLSLKHTHMYFDMALG